jgi:predicted ATPase/class 3 adenylate cyclase
MPEYPSGTVAFLFTDIEGSTKRWERDSSAMRAAVDRHFALLADAISAQNGVLFKTIGDAMQAAFPSVPQAIAAAVAGQSALRKEAWGELGPLRVRMAIHVGEATPKDGDYLAPALNRLARVLGAGYGEQILLTEPARALATTLPADHTLIDLGRHRLRDLLEAERIFQLAGPNLRVNFPPLKSLDLHTNNLPVQPTPLIGRESELAALREMIAVPGVRLITLTGPGGTGKTRLALQVAAESLDTFPDGVWWVPLATVSDPALVLEAIAAALDVRDVPGEPLITILAAYLRTRRTLLILDNLEQIVDAAPLIGQLIDAAPGLMILGTSREPLRLRAEREFPVAPLSVPREVPKVSLDDALASPAVQLFIQRAQAVKPGFTLDQSNAGDVVAIVRRLDGLPLAIELAAARVRILTPPALLARLDQRLALLTGGARDLPARQQTLRAAIAWSHDLLPRSDQALFARLSVFAGGCGFEAADAICEAAGGLEIDLLDGIESLVQKSLLRQEEAPGGEPRFTMLQTIHEFAAERLAEQPEADDVYRAHAEFFFTLATNADWEDLSRQGELLDRLEADHANLRRAIAFYEAQGPSSLGKRVRLSAELAYFWWIRGHLTEGRQILERALSAPGPVDPGERAAALSGAALLAEAQWDLARARRLHEEALALHQTTGDTKGIAESLTGLGNIARQEGDLTSARALHKKALDARRTIGDEPGTAGALLDLGVIRLLEGDYTGAEPVLRESLELFQRSEDVAGEASVLQSLGFLSMSTGQLPEAQEQFRESLRRWRVLGNQQMTAIDLGNLAESLHLSGATDEAEPLYHEALTMFEVLGDPSGRGSALSQLGLLAVDDENPEEAQRLLIESLRLRWNAGERGAAADTLEALAEATWRRGDLESASYLIQIATLVREETGIARQPVYTKRYQPLLDAIAGITPQAASPDIDNAVAGLIAQQPSRVRASVDRPTEQLSSRTAVAADLPT